MSLPSLTPVEWLKRQRTETYFAPGVGQVFPENKEIAQVIEARFSTVSDNLKEWLKNHSATVLYHATKIEVIAEVYVGNSDRSITTTISGMHKDDEKKAIYALIGKFHPTVMILREKEDQIREQVPIMLEQGLDHLFE